MNKRPTHKTWIYMNTQCEWRRCIPIRIDYTKMVETNGFSSEMFTEVLLIASMLLCPFEYEFSCKMFVIMRNTQVKIQWNWLFAVFEWDLWQKLFHEMNCILYTEVSDIGEQFCDKKSTCMNMDRTRNSHQSGTLCVRFARF